MNHPVIIFDSQYLIDTISYGLRMALLLSAPMLIAAVAVGVIISVFQAATQVQEQTLSFVPKIVATFITVMFFGPWVASVVTRFLLKVLTDLPNLMVK